MTTAFIVTVHNGTGSMVEAAQAEYAFGLFRTAAEATGVADRLSQRIATISPLHAADWWCEVQGVHLPLGSWSGTPNQATIDSEIESIFAEVASEWED